MKIDTYLYKNKKLVKKHLNIDAIYDKNNQYITFNEDEDIVEITTNLEYKRITKDHNFTIKNDFQALLEMKSLNQTYILNLTKCDKEKSLTKIKISYIIETEPNVINEIIINIKKR